MQRARAQCRTRLAPPSGKSPAYQTRRVPRAERGRGCTPRDRARRPQHRLTARTIHVKLPIRARVIFRVGAFLEEYHLPSHTTIVDAEYRTRSPPAPASGSSVATPRASTSNGATATASRRSRFRHRKAQRHVIALHQRARIDRHKFEKDALAVGLDASAAMMLPSPRQTTSAGTATIARVTTAFMRPPAGARQHDARDEQRGADHEHTADFTTTSCRRKRRTAPGA